MKGLVSTIDIRRQELTSSKKTTEELSKKVNEIHSPVETNEVTKLCESYVEIVSTIDIVHRVLFVKDEDGATIWTIIDAPPFEDSLRTPIYEAQLKILSSAKEGIFLDFHVLNVSELSKNQNIEDIISSDFDVIWPR
jgi:hypothetical protein